MSLRAEVYICTLHTHTHDHKLTKSPQPPPPPLTRLSPHPLPLTHPEVGLLHFPLLLRFLKLDHLFLCVVLPSDLGGGHLQRHLEGVEGRGGEGRVCV